MSQSRGFFSSLDTREVVREISKSAANHRLNNIYDVGPRTFVMRFGAADSKHRIVIEPGLRMHLTEVDHEKPKLPSHFTLQIRKYIRGWRLFSCTQIGRDRVVDFAFGAGDAPQYHLYIEIWGQGNIVLTDADNKILAFWRKIPIAGSGGAVGKKNAASSSSTEQGGEGSAAAAVGPKSKQIGDEYIPSTFGVTTTTTNSSESQESSSTAAATVSTWTKENVFSLISSLKPQQALHTVLPTTQFYGPLLMKHVSLICGGGIDFGKPLKENTDQEALAEKIAKAFSDIDKVYNDASTPGYYFSTITPAPSTSTTSTTSTAANAATAAASASATATTTEPSSSVVAYAKIPLKQYSSLQKTKTSTFSAAADAYFSGEERKRLADIAKKQQSAQSREDRCRQSIQRRITELETESSQRRRCANALIMNSDDVDKVIQLIGDALVVGTPWKSLTDAIRRQREASEEEMQEKEKKRAKNKNKASSSSSSTAAATTKTSDDDENEDDDDGIDLGSDDDEDDELEQQEAEAALFAAGDDDDEENDEEEDEENNDHNNDHEKDSDDDYNEENNEAARAADEQRYLLSLIYALDLRKNQMTLQLQDPEQEEDNTDEIDQENENDYYEYYQDENYIRRVILVVIDISHTSHENATKYFEAAKKADRSRVKTEDKEEEAVHRAKQSGKKNDKKTSKQQGGNAKHQTGGNKNKQQQQGNKAAGGNIPKQLATAERTPFWFERYLWFLTSAGDLVVTPRDAGQADVLITKFANLNEDIVVMCDSVTSSNSFPTLVKSRNIMRKLANNIKNDNNNNETVATAITSTSTSTTTATSTSPRFSIASLKEAGAFAVCRSTSWQQKSNSKAFWCSAACLTKTAPGRPSLKQGEWFVSNEYRTPLENFSLQLCVALVEATSQQDSFISSSNEKQEEEQEEGGFVTVKVPSTTSQKEKSEAASQMSDRMNSTTSSSSQMMTATSTSNTNTNTNEKQPISEQALRHQQKKAKKIQKKYGEQDEDDREIALALIGSKKSKALELVDVPEPAVTPSILDKKKKKDKKSKKQKEGEEQEEAEENGNNNNKNDGENDDGKKEASSSSSQSNSKNNNNKNDPKQQQQQQKNPRDNKNYQVQAEEAQKNLAEKIQNAAIDFLSFRFVGSSTKYSSSSSSSSEQPQLVRYVMPVCVPVLTMPLNKCRILIVPGNEKRNELAKEIHRSFWAPLGEHFGKVIPEFPIVIKKVTNDETLQQLPATAKIASPFKASHVSLPEAPPTTTTAATTKKEEEGEQEEKATTSTTTTEKKE